MSFDPSLGVAALCVLAGAEVSLLLRLSGRHTLRKAWQAINAGDVEAGRRLLAPFLRSSLLRQREPARIALLAAARMEGDGRAMRTLLRDIDRRALSIDNRRVLAEEEVRALVALGEGDEAVRHAALLEGAGDAAGERRARELHAYALLAAGRTGSAREVLERLAEAPEGAAQAAQLGWVYLQLGQLYRRERREGEARRLLERAAAAADRAIAAQARDALAEGATPVRL